MAFLIPLFAPTIIETTTNIALGISNSIQGDSSSISLQLGKKVFSTHRGFPLTQLPYELREEILLMALEESRSSVSASFLLLFTPIEIDPPSTCPAEPLRPPDGDRVGGDPVSQSAQPKQPKLSLPQRGDHSCQRVPYHILEVVEAL
jgi:hypothetical protein